MRTVRLTKIICQKKMRNSDDKQNIWKTKIRQLRYQDMYIINCISGCRKTKTINYKSS